MKKSILLCIMALLPLVVSAYDVEIDGIYYDLDTSTRSATVTSGDNKYAGTVTIPSYIFKDGEAYYVNIIKSLAFSNCEDLTSIDIPYSVTFISYDAFGQCSNLSSISVDSDNRYYDSRNNCNAIIETATNELIIGCNNTVIPNSVSSIGSHAFRFCDKLSSIIIPNSVTQIGGFAFLGCGSLKTVSISNSVTYIGNGAFANCTRLTDIIIPNSVTSINYATFIGCTSLTSIHIPNSVTSIGPLAFGGCTSLTSIVIPNSVVSIENDVFGDCLKLTDVYCLATDVPEAADNSFSYNITNATLHVPAESIETYSAASPWKDFGSIVALDVPPSIDPEEVPNAIRYLQEHTVIDGTTEDVANAGGTLLRQHLAKIAFRGVYTTNYKQVPSTVPSDDFPTVYEDLTERNEYNEYYYQAARALLYLDYGDGVTPFDRNRLNFYPADSISRLHTLKVLMETFNLQPDVQGTNNPFPTDNDVVSLAKRDPFLMGYVRRAADLGIINKGLISFRPNDYCTRGECFLMTYRIMKAVEDGVLNDPAPTENDYFHPLNTTLKTIAMGAGLSMGNFQHYTKTSFAMSGTVPLTFAHTYNSYNTTLPELFYGPKSNNGVTTTYQPLGDGWSHNYHSFINVVGDIASGNGRAIVHWGGGQIDVYKSENGQLVPESMGVYDEMTFANHVVTIKTKSQVEYRFSRQGADGATVLYLYSITDANGNELSVNYEDGQNGSKRISSVSDGHRSLTFSYLSGSDLIGEVRDPKGRSITFSYFVNPLTGKKQLQSFTDAENNTTTYEYDMTNVGTSKLLTRIQLPKGNYIENQYDANRRLSQTVSGAGNVPTAQTSVSVSTDYRNATAPTTSAVKVTRSGAQSSSFNYTYNQNNAVTAFTGSEGLFRNYNYDNVQHPELPTAMQSNNANVSDIRYDTKGNMEQITVDGGVDGLLTTTMTYDKKNNLKTVTDPRNNTTEYFYDEHCNLTRIEAPEGVTTYFTVNEKGLPTKVENAMGVKTEFGYNSYGNITSTTLPALGISSSAGYDEVSRLTSMTDALNQTTTYEYNNNDFLTRETDAQGHSTRYEYDVNGNLTTITNAKSMQTIMEYDEATDWLTAVRFGNATRRYTYNEDGSVKTFTKPDLTTLSCTYDALGRIVSDGVSTYSYDNDKMQLRSVSKGGKTMTFGYDGFNRITSTTYDGHSNSYGYDENGNLTSLNGVTYDYDGLNRMTSVTFNGKTIAYTYRKDSQLSKVTYPNGMATTYVYDEVGRLKSKQTVLRDGTIIAGYSFKRDAVGNITEQTSQEPYEDIILSDEDTEYTYDDANRILTAGDVSFSFDSNGNTTSRGSEAYEWNVQDQLTNADGTAISYDPMGLIASYGTIRFTTDPLGMGNVLSDTRSGAQYIYGNGLEARVVNGAVSYYVTDFRGSVVAIVDDNGNVTHKYQYDEFGGVTQKQEADYNPFQYVGKYGVMFLTDHLYYMRARHYDPTIGRFLSEDPIWSTNLYPYADNNPIMGIDPEGRATIKKRPLDLGDPMTMALLADASLSSLSTPILDYINMQGVHEQIFFDNPVVIEGLNGGRPISDIGFGGDEDPAMINDERFYKGMYIDTGEYYPDELVLEAIKSYKPSDNGEYNSYFNNCQTYIDKIRRRVKQLEIRKTAQEQARGINVSKSNIPFYVTKTPVTMGPVN